jgi:hypothetical protein
MNNVTDDLICYLKSLGYNYDNGNDAVLKHNLESFKHGIPNNYIFMFLYLENPISKKITYSGYFSPDSGEKWYAPEKYLKVGKIKNKVRNLRINNILE